METEPYRQYTPADYDLLKGWWEGHSWPAVPARILPPLGIIYDNTAAGFLYMDNGGVGVAMLEWLVTNPKASPRAAAKALKKVVQIIKKLAREMDYAFIMTTCRQEGLARLLEGEGFKTTDKQMIHLIGVFT